MKRRYYQKPDYYKIAAIVLAIVFVLSAGFFFLTLLDNKRGNFSENNPDNTHIEYNGKEYTLKKNIETFLVIGVDKFDDPGESESFNNNKMADFLTLFVIDNDAKTCSAVQINRDTIVEYNLLGVAGDKIGTKTGQIALSHGEGNGKQVSCRNTSDAVSKLLMDMRVRHYISITMDAVPVLNDLVGGVEVEIQDDFSNVDPTLVMGEKVLLKGEQALTFVRARGSMADSTNISRMKRQRQYMTALQAKTLEKISSDDNFIIDTSLTMSKYVVSDYTVERLQEVFEKVSTYEFTEINTIDGKSKVGPNFMEFYADEKSIEKIVVKLFYELKD